MKTIGGRVYIHQEQVTRENEWETDLLIVNGYDGFIPSCGSVKFL